MLAATAAPPPALMAAAADDDPPFAAVQPELFAVPNSYSNAWGDYDNDGDLDLAVSLGTGEVRLYRNDKGVLDQRRRGGWACRRPAATNCAA